MGGARRTRSRGAARTLAVTAVVMLAVPLAPASFGGAAGHADEAVDVGDDFLPGHGSARGVGVRVGPSRSGFNFTTDFAVSLADYQNTIARGDSRGVSLGMILETAVEAADEEGESLPQNLRIDSRDEGAADGVSRNEAGTPEQSPLAGAVGSQYVRATEDPFSEVETLMGVLGMEDTIEVEGGTSRATAGIVADGQREARGEATFERVVLAGGLVVLEGLEWSAVHRTGAEEAVEATFTLGGLEVAGTPLLPEEVSQQGADGVVEVFGVANEILSELGLFLEAPQRTRNEDTDEVVMTPLKLSVGPSDLSRDLFGELSDGIQPVREPVFDLLLEQNDAFGAAILLFDVGLGAFAGGGELLVEIGGARAVTGAQHFDDPFGDRGFGEDFGELPDEPEPQTAEAPPPSTDGADLDGGASAPDAPGTAEAPETAADADDEPEAPVTSEPPGEGEDQQLAAPAGTTGQRGGQALVAALVALLVAGGLSGADFLRLRRSQRTIPA